MAIYTPTPTCSMHFIMSAQKWRRRNQRVYLSVVFPSLTIKACVYAELFDPWVSADCCEWVYHQWKMGLRGGGLQHVWSGCSGPHEHRTLVNESVTSAVFKGYSLQFSGVYINLAASGEDCEWSGRQTVTVRDGVVGGGGVGTNEMRNGNGRNHFRGVSAWPTYICC